jgi:ArsR family transcriptional regulator
MQDHDFEVLKVKGAVCPAKDDWPSGDVQISIAGDKPTIKGALYWSALHDCVNDFRDRVLKAFGKMAAIDEDRNLSRLNFDMSGGMDTASALAGLSALAQESRLKVFRLLIQCGPKGMAAGDIARKLRVPHNTLSSHLGILARAQLVGSRKEGRSIIYSVDLEGTRDLLSFLVEDCCRGKREICQPLITAALAECC